MTTQYRMPATGTDARSRKPTPASIKNALAFYSGARERPPPDPQKDTAAPGANRAADGADRSRDEPDYSSTLSPVNVSIAIARLMPRTYAALIASGGSITQLMQALPATAAALSGALR